MLAGTERRVDTVRRHDDPIGIEAVQVDEVVLRPLRDRQYAGGAAHRVGDDETKDRAVAQAHHGRVALEREIVDGHDRRARARDRERVLEVRERGAEPAERAWDGPEHPRLLHPRGHVHGLDPGRDEVGTTGQRGEAKLVTGEGRQVSQQVLDVRLVARPLPAEHVRVDDDERRAHAAASR